MLIHGPHTLALLLARLTGSDGHFDAFEFAFHYDTDTGTITAPVKSSKLASWTFPSPWASVLYDTSLYLAGPISTHALAAGSPTYWELIGRASGVPEPLLHGSAGKTGSGADIVFANNVWALGDPVTLNSLRIYPLRLSYPP